MSPRRFTDGDSAFVWCGLFRGGGRPRVRLSRRMGAVLHFTGVVVRVVETVGVAGQPGFGRAWSLMVALLRTVVQGHRAGEASGGLW